MSTDVPRDSGNPINGVAVAIVRENLDPSGLARIKVSFPWYSRPEDSFWARLATPMTGKNYGTYFLPEVNDEVLVAFERGDIRASYVVGGLWNLSSPPALRAVPSTCCCRPAESPSVMRTAIASRSKGPPAASPCGRPERSRHRGRARSSSAESYSCRTLRYRRMRLLVELSCPSVGGDGLSSSGMIAWASALPSSTPHWSNGLTFQITPCV